MLYQSLNDSFFDLERKKAWSHVKEIMGKYQLWTGYRSSVIASSECSASPSLPCTRLRTFLPHPYRRAHRRAHRRARRFQAHPSHLLTHFCCRMPPSLQKTAR